MSEALKNSTENIGSEGQASKWDNLGKEVPFNDRTESEFWANELEATSKDYENSQKEYAKKNILEKIKAKIKGEAPNRAEREAEMVHDSIKFREANERESANAGATSEEYYPDRVREIEMARAMAEASDKYETKAAKLTREAEEGYGDMSAKQYLNKIDKADKAREKADAVAQEAAEEYDKYGRPQFENGQEIQ